MISKGRLRTTLAMKSLHLLHRSNRGIFEKLLKRIKGNTKYLLLIYYYRGLNCQSSICGTYIKYFPSHILKRGTYENNMFFSESIQ